MQHTSCTEDRIQHALDRCLDGLRSSEYLSQSWSTGWCMNRWSLEELLKRDPENFLILLQQILKRARQVQEECEYELVAPLSIMFKSTLLQTPYCPIECNLLVEACKVFHGFLTWPEPYSSVCHSVLTIVQQELRAPGISYHRLVKEEQGMSAERQRGKTITVLLLNPADVPQTFLSVVQQLSAVDVSQREISINLIKHAFQCSLGSKYHTHTVHLALQSLSDDDLSQTLSCVSAVLETAAMMTDPSAARAHVLTNLEEVRQKLQIPACNGATSNADMLQFLKLPTAKCYMIPWDTDNFDALSEILEREMELSLFSEEPVEEDEVDEEDADEDEEEDEEVEMGRYETDDFLDPRASMFSTTSSLSTASKDSMLSSSSDFSPVSTLSSSSQASGTDSDFCEDIEEDACALMPIGKNKNATALSKRLSRLFKPRGHSLCRAKSLGNTDCKDKKDFLPTARAKRSNSMPQQVLTLSAEPVQSDSAPVRPMCFRKRPILSSDEDEDMGTMLIRVMVFGADYVAGKLARAYTSLRNREKLSPRLTKHCRMKFFFIPVKRDPFSNTAASQTSTSPLKTVQDMNMDVYEDSTSNIAHLLGMLDPWYKRNTLCLLNLPMHVVCQQTFKPDSESVEESVEGCLPIMADLLLYYCRNAARPALIQLYQAELTLAGGETRTEVFIHSLELGHTAATRAIKAMGAASKRFGIDGDREAVPLSLEVVYNQVVISGRGQKTRAEKVCTSVNLTKVCRNQEELNPKLEFLQLTMTEVLKRQNSKSKRSYNQQLSVTQVKVDRFRVCGSGNTTFAVCLDQDEKKILQSVTRCEVSVCNKPDSSSDWMKTRPLSSQVDQTFYSLLCLPVCTFSGPQP
ncbi:phosphoinositide 3-kinase regulatory subunit 5 isoform X1 [Silurus meridionalis]|uniref:phosphoinositide 3-kinase regulatory subunit 5 isoform X1 n=1 Tax=Silurus meridionalis TaxID=175797 RepID=UPI001EEBD455|nr:phosphoinositide 3-kinase regulatory subunit 5 isoform X1 [Silurus meridionalis]XP_046706102.1 phosphoinositide 3-kinase regulatory subunit 5 isoform X1 [Silurus meridionalis]XP_046706111.1 phosphoinositide 3-kinase regulatory subunit 5 isoform X1 [Silurus meridionalis]XP_046706118.1 phosphoinositide 3-kinase regulatory subunit 5 isoform X1 [Silurus meridionalis]